jgi:lipopolysaccharide transport system permease protein
MLNTQTNHSQNQLLVLEPGRAEANYWLDVWQYRDLFYVLAWRDVTVRYKQTVLGIAWAVLRPLLTMLIFSVVFGRIAKLPSDGDAPYTLLVLAGMLPWTLFSTGLSEAANSLIANANLVSKIYFPRIIVPAATIVAGIIDFGIGMVLLVIFMLLYRYPPSAHVVFLPIFIALTLLASLGPGLWLAAQNIRYRDFRYIVPFLVQIGIYVSPVGFSSSVVPEGWRLLYSLNPMVGVIDGFRWCILGTTSAFYWPGFLISSASTLLMLWLGIAQFRKTEKSFADVI